MLTLACAVLLLLGVLISERASRTVLSTAVLFLLGGFVLGQGVVGVVPITPGSPVVGVLAQPALFSVLYTDGMTVGLYDLRRAWRLPGRALLLGLPLSLLHHVLLAHYPVGLPWLPCLLLVAALAPPAAGRPSLTPQHPFPSVCKAPSASTPPSVWAPK